MWDGRCWRFLRCEFATYVSAFPPWGMGDGLEYNILPCPLGWCVVWVAVALFFSGLAIWVAVLSCVNASDMN